MTSHRDCIHPKTKAARARCRKNQAARAADLAKFEADNQAYHDTYIRPYQEQETARKEWETESSKFCEAHVASANQNADDTSVEEGFAEYSKRWYEVAISTLHSARDDAERCLDLDEIDNGQVLDFIDQDYYWVDRVIYPSSGVEVTLVDREGNRKTWMLDDLKRLETQRKAYRRYISDGIGDTDGYYAPISFEAWCATLGKGI
jgi:hypothetical protein